MQQTPNIYEKKIMPIHPLTPEGVKYVESMTEPQKQLHELAIEKLASSYFVEKTHGFKAYLKKMGEKTK